MISKSIARIRKSEFERQDGRCYYCGFRMWHQSPEPFALLYQRFVCEIAPFQATAEHLCPRSEGGSNRRDNIAVACLFCNQARRSHAAKAPTPQEFRAHVQSEVAQGRWHPKWAFAKLGPKSKGKNRVTNLSLAPLGPDKPAVAGTMEHGPPALGT